MIDDGVRTSASTARRVGAAGALVVGVAFGMARFAFGLTLPDVRADLGLSDVLLGLVAGGSFAGFLLGVVLAAPLAARRGPRAPTTVGGVCGATGAVLVAVAPSAAPMAVGVVLAGSSAGWVWAPYSDIVAAVVPPPGRPRVLAAVSTGTSGGLVLLGLLAVVGPSWRGTWAGIGVATAVAALVNVRWVPRGGPSRRPAVRTQPGPPRVVVYALAYFATTTLWFTYAVDAVRAGGQGAAAGPVLFAVVGVLGSCALGAGGLAVRIGTAAVATGCLTTIAAGLALLGLGSGSLVLVVVSAVVFGPGYMAGAAVLAIWTAQLAPDRATASLTAVLVVGAVASVVVPVLVGALVGAVGLPPLLLAAAATAVVVAVGLLLARRPTDRP